MCLYFPLSLFTSAGNRFAFPSTVTAIGWGVYEEEFSDLGSPLKGVIHAAACNVATHLNLQIA